MENKDDFLLKFRIIEYESYSNSGNTFYGNTIICDTHISSGIIGGHDVILFDKYYSEMTAAEISKYSDAIEEKYKYYLDSFNREIDFNIKKNKWINANKHILTYPIFLLEYYDSASIYKQKPASLNLGERITVYENESDLIEDDSKENYCATHIIYAVKHNLCNKCGYEISSMIKQEIINS